MKGKRTINDDEIFECPAPSFCIGASPTGYTLNYSTNYDPVTEDGDWDAWDEDTPAGEQCIVVGAQEPMYFKLVGNAGELPLTFQQQW